MKIKSWLINSLAVFLVFEVLNFLIHSVILSSQYAALTNIWRSNMVSRMWVMSLADAIFALVFVYIFSKGYEDKGIWEGVRFGLLVGTLIIVFSILGQYVVYPVPFVLALQWIIFGMLQVVICGIVISYLYKKLS
ncbi:hypothetical protein ACFLZV_06395 [Candidatus Margulisiibacteriota bacterium]